MTDDLVKRLMASRSVWTNENGRAESRPSDLEMEAASALVAKDAEIARLRGLIEQWRSARTAMMNSGDNTSIDARKLWDRLSDAESNLATA